jgi:hypothetical protein
MDIGRENCSYGLTQARPKQIGLATPGWWPIGRNRGWRIGVRPMASGWRRQPKFRQADDALRLGRGAKGATMVGEPVWGSGERRAHRRCGSKVVRGRSGGALVRGRRRGRRWGVEGWRLEVLMAEEGNRRRLASVASHDSTLGKDGGARSRLQLLVGGVVARSGWQWRKSTRSRVDGTKQAGCRAVWVKRIWLLVAALGTRSRQWPVHVGGAKLNMAENGGRCGLVGT